ncbi:uncharacterized protein [Glycine max]|uniref:uncharacterized protein n=1 Tax=Glycine max TaxID=3847 RepID=UPI0003DE9A50|nr:uncharacterized protein LOC102667845 [Glycine max]|eukprot:XP_006590011.1 uncharacterized protein LOC102667845 [Glycine max]
MSNHKSTKSAIKNLEIQVGQLAKQIIENSSGNFGANTEKNLKEECKVVMTRGKKAIIVEDERRNVSVGKALIDLGASINLMPLSMCRRIGELEIMATRMTLQLANRYISRPYGMVEDVLVKVRQFTFTVDFVIMDIEEDAEIPLILGCPFMLTANCVVDIGKGNLEIGIDDQKITFDLFDAKKHSLDRNVYSKMDEVENEMVLMARAKLAPDP